MIEQELIKKVWDHLIESNSIFVENSIRYIGVRENYIISNEEPRDYYFLGFDAVADKSNIYSTNSYFVLIDKVLEKISYIIGPQSSEKID